MGFIAIVGSGALGGAVAHALAVRDRVPEVRLIDPAGSGRARQGPRHPAVLAHRQLQHHDSPPAESIDAAVGADVVVIADAAAGNVEHSGEAGLGLLRHLVRAGSRAPILCAGASQRELIAKAVTELHVSRALVLGSAPFALESALRALAGLVLDGSGVEVGLRVVGVPPRAAVVAWEEATAYGQPLSSQMAPHAIAGTRGADSRALAAGAVRARFGRGADRRGDRARVATPVFLFCRD